MNSYNTINNKGKFSCDCPYFIHKKTDCKHIQYLKFELGIETQLPQISKRPIDKTSNLKSSLENFGVI